MSVSAVARLANIKKTKPEQRVIVAGFFVAIFIIFSIILPGFLSVGNMLTMVRSVAILGILGLGMALTIIGRGIDLSMVALMVVPTGVILALAGAGVAVPLAIIAGLALALAVGVFNGYMTAYAEVHPLLVTLATGLGLAGLGQAILPADQVLWPDQLNSIVWLGGAEPFDIPSSILVFVACIVGLYLFLRHTQIGRFMYSIGDNPEGARTVGIPVRPIVILQYVGAAVLSVIAGLTSASSSSVIDARTYNGTLIFEVILVAVLGGVGLSGGRGGVTSVVIGALLVGLILNGMTIMNFSVNVQNVVLGVILLAAIGLDSVLNPRNEETAQQGDI